MVHPLRLPPHPPGSCMQLSGSIVLSGEDTSQGERKEKNSHKDDKLCIVAREEANHMLLSSSLLCPSFEALGTRSHTINVQRRGMGMNSAPVQASLLQLQLLSPGTRKDAHSLNLCEGNPS